jgi:hypothetical protein
VNELGDNGRAGPQGIRSYQRIFNPERRVYAIEGHTLPVPGGVPLRWLGYASSSLLCILILEAHSLTIAFLAALAAGLVGLGVGGRVGGLAAGCVALVGVQLGGWVITALDWPMRLIVVPGMVATLATQATPDGRKAHRFALSWLILRLTPRRQSLGRGLPAEPAAADPLGWTLWVAPDECSAALSRGRLRGPAEVAFTAPVEAQYRHRKVRVRRLGWRSRRGSIVRSLTVAPGEELEVRP